MLDPLYQATIQQRLALPLHEGPDKTTTLAEALRRHVPAGATVYLGAAHGRPNTNSAQLLNVCFRVISRHILRYTK